MEIPAVWIYLHATISIALAFYISGQSTKTKYIHAHGYTILLISQLDLNGPILEQVTRIELEWSVILLYSRDSTLIFYTLFYFYYCYSLKIF